MAFDFPATPAIGFDYPTTPPVGVPQYSWDGEKWAIEPLLYPDLAPVLAAMTGVADNTPEFNLTGDIALGDIIRFQWDTVNTFGSGALVTSDNAIDTTENTAMQVDFVMTPLANGTWYFRARIVRGATLYDWSNIVSIAISV